MKDSTGQGADKEPTFLMEALLVAGSGPRSCATCRRDGHCQRPDVDRDTACALIWGGETLRDWRKLAAAEQCDVPPIQEGGRRVSPLLCHDEAIDALLQAMDTKASDIWEKWSELYLRGVDRERAAMFLCDRVLDNPMGKHEARLFRDNLTKWLLKRYDLIGTRLLIGRTSLLDSSEAQLDPGLELWWKWSNVVLAVLAAFALFYVWPWWAMPVVYLIFLGTLAGSFRPLRSGRPENASSVRVPPAPDEERRARPFRAGAGLALGVAFKTLIPRLGVLAMIGGLFLLTQGNLMKSALPILSGGAGFALSLVMVGGTGVYFIYEMSERLFPSPPAWCLADRATQVLSIALAHSFAVIAVLRPFLETLFREGLPGKAPLLASGQHLSFEHTCVLASIVLAVGMITNLLLAEEPVTKPL